VAPLNDRVEDFVATVALRMITIIASRADERDIEASTRHVSNTSKITVGVGLEAEIATRERRRNSGPASFNVNIFTTAVAKGRESKLLKTKRASNKERPKDLAIRESAPDLQIVASGVRDPNLVRSSIGKIDRGNSTKSRSISLTYTRKIRLDFHLSTRTVSVNRERSAPVSRERSAPLTPVTSKNQRLSLTFTGRGSNRRRLFSLTTLVLGGLVTRVTRVESQRRRARRRAIKTKKTLARSLFLVLGRPRDKKASTRKKDSRRSSQRWSMHNSGGI
jgi:hypothetical protein